MQSNSPDGRRNRRSGGDAPFPSANVRRSSRRLSCVTTPPLEQLIDEVMADAYGLDEQLSSFCQVFVDEVDVPHSAMSLGVEIEVLGFDYPADERRGLVAQVRNGPVEQELSLADVCFPEDSVAGWVHAAYRTWLGLSTFPARRPAGWAWGDT